MGSGWKDGTCNRMMSNNKLDWLGCFSGQWEQHWQLNLIIIQFTEDAILKATGYCKSAVHKARVDYHET